MTHPVISTLPDDGTQEQNTPIKVDELKPFDAAEFLDDPEDIAEYLRAAFETGDYKYFAKAVGTAARAQGMTEMSNRTGMQRDAIYRLTSGKSSPRLDTISKVMSALGVGFEVRAVS